MRSMRLRPQHRIRKAVEFQACREKGKKVFSKHLICLFNKNDYPHPRIGLIVTKKIGPAVIRNRWKRVIRDFFRTHMEHFNESIDCVFIVKATFRSKPPEDFKSELAKLMGKIRI